MKTKLTLLATGVGIALLGFTAGAYDYDDYRENFPEEHLGARHIPFTGTHTILGYTDEGTPTPDGHGFREAQRTSEMTIAVPDLGITDLVLPFVISANADLDAEGNGTAWGKLVYVSSSRGWFHFAGQDKKVSDTLMTRTRQYGGCFWYGPLDGANLLATEQIEEILDGEGTVVSTTSVVEGILIVPFYADFAPFEGVDPLPPLKPVTEIPTGTGWRSYVLNSEETVRFELPKIFIHQYLSCAELGIRDLSFPILQTAIRADFPIGRRYGEFEFLPTGQSESVCGRTAFQGMMGYIADSRINERHDYMDHTGVLQTGPLAGCMYVRSHGNSYRAQKLFHLSTVLLVPDSVHLDLSEPQKMLNISERGRVGEGEDVLITGFVVSGKGPRTVLVRAVGPTLEEYGVTGFLADPQLEVIRNTETGPVSVGVNNNWIEDNDQLAIETASTKAGAFELQHDEEAAILFSWLEPGAYTVQVSGPGDATGVVLAEVYQLGD